MSERISTEAVEAAAPLVIEALWQHRAKPTGSPFCACGWRPSMMLNDTDSDRRQHVAHQAQMLADAGLVADESEWSAALSWGHLPNARYVMTEDEVRKFIAAGDPEFGWEVQRREVTPWRTAEGTMTSSQGRGE